MPQADRFVEPADGGVRVRPGRSERMECEPMHERPAAPVTRPAADAGRRWLVFALAGCNLLFLMLAASLFPATRASLAHAIGSGNAVTGLLALALAWLVTWGATAHAVRGLPLTSPPSWWRAWQRGMCTGALTGLAVFASVMIALTATALREGAGDALLLFAAAYGVIGAATAAITGAAAGFVLATILRALAGCAAMLAR